MAQDREQARRDTALCVEASILATIMVAAAVVGILAVV